MFTRLVQVHQAVAFLQNAEHLQAWHTTLTHLADQNGLHGLLAGRACALLFDQGVFSPDEVSRRLGLSLSTITDPALAAAWVDGLLKDNGSLLVHQDTFWHIMDAWVMNLLGDTFIALLPLLRRTFSTFTSPERRALGERARQGLGVRRGAAIRPGTETIPDFDVQRAEAVLPLVSKLLGISVEIGERNAP